MRAWLLILAVLATLQINTQVASTEEYNQVNLNFANQPQSPTTTSSSTTTTTTTATTSSTLSNSNKIRNSDSTSDQVDVEDNEETTEEEEEERLTLRPDPETLVKVQNTLLSAFGMKRRPRHLDRSKIIIPEAMKKLYAELTGQEINSVNIPKPGLLTKSANTVRSFTHQESKIDERFPQHHKFRLSFNLSSIPENEKLKAAELQINRDAIDLKNSIIDSSSSSNISNKNSNKNSSIRYQVFVYDILRVGIKGQREPSFRLIDTKHIWLNSTDTISFDVQPAVERWLVTPKTNHGLLIEVREAIELKPAPHHHVRLRRSVDEHREKWLHKQPVLYTYTDDRRQQEMSSHSRRTRDVSSGGSGNSRTNNQQQRSKRHNGRSRKSSKRKDNRELCQRRALFVDFSEVGWDDWILAPAGYDAFYCGGECPRVLSEHLNATNHAVVQNLVHQHDPAKVPKPCCVPTQLAPIFMLFVNEEGKMVLKSYENMSVVGCGCR